MATKKTQFSWQDKVINHAQIGGIETSVLDDGLGRGTRIAWVNTGSGLRYKVVIDRGLDIVDAFYNQHSLVWLSHAGVTAPRPDANKGLEWLWTFGGGLLTTCGLTHVGGPENDASASAACTGGSATSPPRSNPSSSPTSTAGNPEMSITALVKESRVFGPNLELRRTISSTLGEPTIRIHDVVTNVGNSRTPHMILYHCNYGWPLVDEGTKIVWKGRLRVARLWTWTMPSSTTRTISAPARVPWSGIGARARPAASSTSRPTRTACAPSACTTRSSDWPSPCGTRRSNCPSLANWQHWGPGEYVTGLEPGTNPPIGQGKAREQKQLLHLDPGQSRTYDLEIRVLTQEQGHPAVSSRRGSVAWRSTPLSGFGFGPIQAGLFAKEAFQSGHFRRIVVAEIDQRLVDAVRSNGGTYYVNVARSDRIETVRIDGVELLNPTNPEDATALQTALSEATEITTCLPSVNFFDSARRQQRCRTDRRGPAPSQGRCDHRLRRRESQSCSRDPRRGRQRKGLRRAASCS